MTGENKRAARRTAAYGSGRHSHRRDDGSSARKRRVAGASIAIVYFDNIPRPTQRPTPNQAFRRSPISARSRKYSVPDQAAVSGASGVITSPVTKKNGSTQKSMSAMNAEVLP